jgi:NAD(P)-dependent dehydrogenase (short-subunit alcohol dehydrogenase family)
MTLPPRTVPALMDLSGRVALVTGGAGHVGLASAAALAELGAAVALSDRDAEACAAAVKRMAADCGGRAACVAADLADEAAVRGIPERVVAELGGLDILVHCAAFTGDAGLPGWVTRFEDQSPESWRAALGVNLDAVFILTQAAVPALRRSGRGSVIAFASIYGLVGPDLRLYAGTTMGNPAAYAASKGGLLQLTRWLATVLAPDVRVNAISPGGLLRGQPPEFVRRYESRTPLGRLGREEDLKGAVAYLASDLSAYVTGHNLVVDGGWTAW